MEIKTIQYIECDEIFSLIDTHWAELSFAKGAENGSFHYFFCDDKAITTIRESIANFEDKFPNYILQCRNDLKLIYALREQGITDGIYIHIFW